MSRKHSRAGKIVRGHSRCFLTTNDTSHVQESSNALGGSAGLADCYLRKGFIRIVIRGTRSGVLSRQI